MTVQTVRVTAAQEPYVGTVEPLLGAGHWMVVLYRSTANEPITLKGRFGGQAASNVLELGGRMSESTPGASARPRPPQQSLEEAFTSWSEESVQLAEEQWAAASETWPTD